jgi:outer membrane receptor protein involved in Fe transport
VIAPDVDTTVPTDAYDIFDFSGRFTFASRGEVRFGIDNLFDREPEIVFADAESSGLGQTNANHYDILGRRYYVGLSVSF